MGFLATNTPIPENSLWKFSLELYSIQTNQEALLYLQDQHQLNINVLLALLWYAASGRGSCPIDLLAALLATLKPWQEGITNPLRDIRKSIDKKRENLYSMILDTEVFSEKIQQCVIYDFFTDSLKKSVGPSKKASDGINNIQNYLSIMKINVSDLGYQHIRHLLSQTFVAFKEDDFPQMSLEL